MDKERLMAIDDEIARLYGERMAIVKESGVDRLEDKATLNRISKLIDSDLHLFAKQLFNTVFDTARGYYNSRLTSSSVTTRQIENALAVPDRTFPTNAVVACQGVEGSYSSISAERLFQLSEIMYFRNFDGVFNAVEKGFCEFGILPIENSTVGSVNAVYDLMKQHKFYIVRSIKLRVQHHLLTKQGVSVNEITEIFSHEQALNQCSEFFKQHPTIKVTVCANTAVAAQMVKDSDRLDIACISSRECAEIYGLSILASNIQDSQNNYTRFICISKTLKIYEDDNKISLMLSVPNVAGSLTKIINKFSTLSLNMTKLESRPMPNTSFEFLFYFDFDAKIGKKEVQNLITELENGTEQFAFLGSYQEIE